MKSLGGATGLAAPALTMPEERGGRAREEVRAIIWTCVNVDLAAPEAHPLGRDRPLATVDMIAGLPLEADLVARLVLAAVLGAVVGSEREIHGHPAGMRTHLLVSLGSGLFTVVSIHGFLGVLDPAIQAPVDPSRVAAQIVTGIGFLGAGAILKDGLTIRGLTTAASLWVTAAIGLAAGAGEAALSVLVTVIAFVSLWPLNAIAERLHGQVRQRGRIRFEVVTAGAIDRLRAALEEAGIEIVGLKTSRIPDGIAVDFEIDSREADVVRVASRVGQMDDVRSVEAARQE